MRKFKKFTQDDTYDMLTVIRESLYSADRGWHDHGPEVITFLWMQLSERQRIAAFKKLWSENVAGVRGEVLGVVDGYWYEGKHYRDGSLLDDEQIIDLGAILDKLDLHGETK